MSPQMEALVGWIKEAKAGNASAMKLVRQVLKTSMEVCPDRDALLIADAFVELSPQFSPAQEPERNGE